MLSYAMRWPYQKGFTLTELVLTMVIMGVLTVVVAPRFVSVQAYSSRAAYNDVLSSLRYAQKLAVVSGCQVRYSINEKTYSLFQREPGAEEDCNTPVAPWTTSVVNMASSDNIQNYDVVSFENDVVLTSNNFPLIFNALGQSINAGGVPDVSPTATLTVNGSQITIWAETGFVDGVRAY